jgi:hypothetical protein
MQKTTLPIFFAAVLLLAVLAVVPAALAAPITVATDKDAYAPGESLNVSGTATANAWISIQVFDPDGKRKAIAQTQAAADGSWSKTAVYTFAEDDPQGTWTVKAYDSSTGELEETTFTFPAVPADVIPPTLTVSVTPDKTLYGIETITIVVTADEDLDSCSITVTQKGASPVSVETAAAVDMPSKWGGSYTIQAGYSGTATIDVAAADLAGNESTATAYIEVDAVAPKVTVTAPATTTEAKIAVSGSVDDPDIKSVTILVDTKEYVATVVAGKFSTTLTLPALGAYTITAKAVDAAGNAGEASTSVSYITPPPPPIKVEDIVDPLSKDIAGVKSDVAGVKSDIAALKADVGGVKSDIAGVKGDISAVKGDISAVKGDISGVKGDISGLKTDVAAVKSDLAAIKSDLAALSDNITGVGAAVGGLSTLILVAVVLSLIAAVAAIAAVVTIARKVVMK